VHRLQRRPRFFDAYFLTRFRRPSANPIFNRTRRGDAFHRFDRDWRLLRLDQVMELAANMRHARSLLKGPVPNFAGQSLDDIVGGCSKSHIGGIARASHAQLHSMESNPTLLGKG
jgi:hypothetical protein